MKDGRKLVAIGGIGLGAEEVGPLIRRIELLCEKTGFPKKEPFKWSPDRNRHWMHENLKDEARTTFYRELMELVVEADGTALVMMEDDQSKPILRGLSHEESVVQMFLERVSGLCRSEGSQAYVIADRSKSKAEDDEKFLAACLEAIESKDSYVLPEKIAHPVVSAPFRLSRMLQVADVITSCTAALVGGSNFAAEIFPFIRPMFARNQHGMIGGTGIKIHPGYRYVNLYHWLFEDSHYYRLGSGQPLPMSERPYDTGADSYSIKLTLNGEELYV